MYHTIAHTRGLDWMFVADLQNSYLAYLQGVSGSLSKCLSLLLRLESNLLAQTGDIFFLLIGTFWYLVSKKFHNHSVIIHLVRNLRCETVKIWKYIKNWCFRKVNIVLQISPQRKLGSLYRECARLQLVRAHLCTDQKSYKVDNYWMVMKLFGN